MGKYIISLFITNVKEIKTEQSLVYKFENILKVILLKPHVNDHTGIKDLLC